MELPSAGAEPGKGQQQVVRALRDNHKLRLPEDNPDAPAYIRDRTPLKKGRISTGRLRDEFRRDPALPMLVGDDVFIRGIRQGVDAGVYVYQSGDLIWAQGLPAASVKIDEQSYVMTAPVRQGASHLAATRTRDAGITRPRHREHRAAVGRRYDAFWFCDIGCVRPTPRRHAAA